MRSSRGEEWRQVRSVEDILALLDQAEEQRRVIRVQAWREGSWRAVYAEATAMGPVLAALKAELSRTWAKLFEVAGGDDGAG